MAKSKLDVAVACRRPDDLLPPEAKGFDWILNYSKWIWYDFDTSQVKKMFFGNRGRYQEIKDYAMGKQSIDRYKPLLNIAGDENETELNIDWSIIPVYPKFRRIALRKLNKVAYNIIATPIDALAQDEQNTQYAKLKAKILAKKAFADIGSPIADNPRLQPQSGEPRDEKELDILFRFPQNLDMAVEMETGIELIFYQNDMRSLQNQWNEDVIDFGVAIGKDYIDSNGFIRIERVDPEMFVVDYCKKKDFSDKKYAAVVKELTIGELKQQAQDQFTPTEYQDIANNVMGSFGNPQSIPANVTDTKGWYDNLKVWVLDAEFFSVNQIAKEKVIDKRGNLLIGNASVDKNGKLRGELVRTSYRVVYQSNWIIGTNYMYNYGLKTNMLRAKSSLTDTDMSYKIYAPDFYKMNVTATSEQVIPICDEIQMDWYHLQNVKNEAVPKGIAIDITSLENVPLGKGGKQLQPLELVDLFKKKGVLIYRRIESNDGHQELRPIEELENGIGADAKFYFDSIVANINLLKEIAGFNDFTDASTPNPKALTTIANMAYEGTANSLGHAVETTKFLIEKISTEVVLALQDLVSMGVEVSGYLPSLGSNTPRMFKLSKNISNYEYGIRLEDKPDDQEKQLLIQEADTAMKAGQITYADFVYIKNIENLKQAEMVMAYRIEEREKSKLKESAMLQQQNADVQTQSNISAEQAKQQTLMLEHKLAMEKLTTEKQLDAEIQDKKYMWEMRLQKMESDAQITDALIGADSQEFIAQKKIEGAAQDQAHKDAAKVMNKKSA